jgi:hypothetical protein
MRWDRLDDTVLYSTGGRASLSERVVDFYLEKHGNRATAESEIMVLLVNVHAYQDVPLVALFGRFLNIFTGTQDQLQQQQMTLQQRPAYAATVGGAGGLAEAEAAAAAENATSYGASASISAMNTGSSVPFQRQPYRAYGEHHLDLYLLLLKCVRDAQRTAEAETDDAHTASIDEDERLLEAALARTTTTSTGDVISPPAASGVKRATTTGAGTGGKQPTTAPAAAAAVAAAAAATHAAAKRNVKLKHALMAADYVMSEEPARVQV